LDPVEAASLVAGIATPLVVLWLAALVFLRTDPTREQRLALNQGLLDLLAPVEQAERRINAMTQRLKKQIEAVEAASDIASDRLGHLESRFQTQINELFTAT